MTESTRFKSSPAPIDIAARTVTIGGVAFGLAELPADIVTALALKGLRAELVGIPDPAARFAELVSGARSPVRTVKEKAVAMTDIQMGLATTLMEERARAEKVSGIDKARRSALMDQAKADILALDRANLALAKTCAITRKSLLTVPGLAPVVPEAAGDLEAA